ncbi:hypothetical protein ANOM_009722 [Aspergillus nomiae NRRL 13137]|uniref:enoyl-[acyl-carrier-protein] reductase n=1 Tax=Aspergillus nomiae NRRL (strain ATCC 15546 / NRRL 13137 / CBS 260.88 / M93) TaxID=1509407 RepID=A0A0L1IR36_ASPN3|nr:uncharacterized protein ANOM_009722 [Aspergillus nomiae NRRL 13137]KNG81929.1 hypothetical protein ANOM_009722 [Aspergillus nomiae NRRL 13137]
MSAQTVTFQRQSTEPASVIRIYRHDAVGDAPIPADSVLLKFLAAPVNPQDLLVIAGRYPVQPHHRYNNEPIPGYDGVARIERVGTDVDALKPGDHVIPRAHGLGTWRTEAVVPAAAVLKVSKSLEPTTASLLKTGCSTAYLLLESCPSLRPGDWVVLNAATGWIARMVVQFALLKGCPSICARVVVTESQLANEGPAAIAAGKRITLALDAVFGQSGQRLAAMLAPGATFINYGSLGGAGGQVVLSQELIFWKQITFKNFRLSQALGRYTEEAQIDLLSWFTTLFEEGKITAPSVNRVDWAEDGDGGNLESKVQSVLAKVGGKVGPAVGCTKHVVQF